MMNERAMLVCVFSYNRPHFLVNLVKSIKKFLTGFDYVIVDDGSSDDTWEKILKQCKEDKRITAIKFSRNFGHHYAITAGLHNALGDLVVVMDGDLQDRPSVIPMLHAEIQKGFDVVFVNRTNRPESFLYKAAQKLFYVALRALSGYDFD